MLRDLRVKVRTRHSRVSSCGGAEFLSLSKQFFSFIKDNSVLKAICAELLAKNPKSVGEAKSVRLADDGRPYGETSEEAATIGYVTWQEFASQEDPNAFWSGYGDFDESVDEFRDRYIEPLFDYIDEVLDDANVVLALLNRYKQKVEWYRKAEVAALYSTDTTHGEKNLAKHMYEFLFDQGLPIYVEPVTASGRPDVVSLDDSEHPFIADVKVFDGSGRGASYVKKGLYQVYRYCWDYNQSMGHLIVFNVSNKQLRLELPSHPDGVPRFEYNHKTIFVTVIDIHEHEGTASTRGISDTVTITAEEMVREVEREANESTEVESPARTE